MVDIVKETLEDGTEYQFDMDVSHDITESIFESLLEMQDNLENFDFEATVFCIFASSLSILAGCGWEPEALRAEIDSQITSNKESMN